MVAGRGLASALGLVLVGIAICVLGVLFATSGGQMTITINDLLLGVGVVNIPIWAWATPPAGLRLVLEESA